MREATPVMETALAEALDRYAAASGHRLVKEILAEHEDDLFRRAPPETLRIGKRHGRQPRQQRFYWLDKD